MTKKIIFSVLIAVFLVGLFIGILEKHFIWWNVFLGLPIMFFVSLNLATQINEQRSPMWLFIISAVFLLFLYIVIKINTLGIYVSSIIGLLIGFMLYYGWILPHKPFSREEYMKEQNGR